MKRLYPELLSDAESYFGAGKPQAQQADALLVLLLEALGTPGLPQPLMRYLRHPAALYELCRALHNQDPESYHDLLVVGSAPRNTTRFCRVRELGSYGTYPSQEWGRKGQAFVLRQGQPYLVTTNHTRAEEASIGYTEVSHIARNEIKLASAFLIPEGNQALCMYLDGETHDIPIVVLEEVPKELVHSFVAEYAQLLSRAHRPQRLYGVDSTAPYRGEFESLPIDMKAVTRVFDRFNISDYLLLRVATYLVKATMMWRPEPFREEAIANVFFALEGCLLLLQRKEGLDPSRIDRRRLPAVFDRLFRQGSALFDFIDEAVGWGGRRASIVHPQVDISYSWIPSLAADDYYEYKEVVRMLLAYVLTDEVFEDYRP